MDKLTKTTKRPYAQKSAQRRSIYTDDETWAKLLRLKRYKECA